LLFSAAVTVGGFWINAQDSWLAWVCGQIILAVALLRWFVVLHEAGHGTLFATGWLNLCAGHLASVFAIIPLHTWKRIHAKHHRHTGWKDLDPTTAALVPRPLAPLERGIIDLAWKTGLPLFSILYRAQNFWHPLRFARHERHWRHRVVAGVNIACLALVYVTLAVWFGPLALLAGYGLALFLCLILQDPILLSQHTQMPSELSGGKSVRRFMPLEQERFTRSLRFPKPISRFLLGFDRHELHHMYVAVPGPKLHRIDYRTMNEADWFTWLRMAKRVPGTELLFGGGHAKGRGRE